MTFAERLAKNAEREKKVEEKFNKNNPLTPYRGTYQKNMISQPLLKTNTPEKPNFSQALPSFNTIQQNKAEQKFENANNVENEAKEFASIIFQKYGNTDSFRANLEKATTDFANNYKGDYKEAPTVFKNTMGTFYTESLLTDLITNPSIDNYNSFVNKVNSKSNSLVKPTYNGSDLLAVASSIMYKNNKDFNMDNDAYAKKIFGDEEKNISALENQKNEKTKKKQDKSLFDRVNDFGEEAGDMALQAAGILLPGKFGDNIENKFTERRAARQDEKDKEANLGNEISALNEEIEYRKSNLYSQKKYYELSRKSDFEKNSKFIEGKTPSLDFGDDKAVRMGLVVNVPEERKKELNKLGYDNLGYTPEQKKVAYYIANTQGKDAAQEYIDNLKGMTSVNSANYLKIRDGEHIGTKLGYQTLAGMESLYNIPTEIKNTFTGNTEYKTADTTTSVADMMASEAKGTEKIILGGTRGIIELAPSLAITAATGGAGAPSIIAKLGRIASKGLFAGNVFAKSYREAVNSGNDWSTATGFGLGSAGLELGLEQLSGITLGGTTPKVSFVGKVTSKFDDIFKLSPKLRAVASTAGRLVENFAGEFTEEYVADEFNPVLRNVFLGENNEFKVYDYEFVESGLIGGFTGAILGSPSFVTNIARTFKPGNYGANVAFYNTAFDGVLENEMFKSNNKVFEGMDKEQKSEAINRYRAEKIYEAAYDSIFGYVSQAVIEGNSVDDVFDNLKKEGIDTAEYKDEINHAYDVASASTGPSARLTAFAEKELAKGGTIGSVVKALTDDGSIIGKISEFDGLEGNELTKAVRKKVSSVQKESGFLKTVNELINKGESTYGIFDNIYQRGGSFINAFRDADGEVNKDDALRTIENAQKNAIAKEIKIKNLKGSDAIKFMDDAMTRLEQKNTEYKNNAKATNNKVNAINTVSESVLNSIKTTAKADASLSDINTAVSEAIITSDFSSENFTGKLASIYTDALRSKNANAYIAVSQSGIDIPDALITYKESGTIPENVNSNAFKAIGDAFNGITESAITQVEAARTVLANDVADSASEGENGAGEAENAPVEEVVSWSEEDIKDISTEEREKTQKILEGMGYNGEREYNRIMKAVNKSPNKSTKVFDAFRTAFAYLYEHGYKNEAFDPAKVKILGVKNIERIFNAGAKDKTAKQAVKRKDKGVVIKDAAYKAAKLSKREAKMLDGIAAITGRDIRFDATLPGNAKIDLNTGEIVISTTANTGSAWAMIHEVFHAMSVSVPAEARLLKNTILDIVRKNSGAFKTLLNKYVDVYGNELLDENGKLREDAYQYVTEEMVCDLLGYVISRPDILSTITGEQRNVIQRFIDRLVSYFTSKDILNELGLSDEVKSAFLEVGKEAKAIAEMFRKALEAEKVQAEAMPQVKEAEKKTVTEDGVKHSLIGFAEDGRKIYKTNYPDNTPKLTKQLDVIALVQHIWQKKPITLSIFEDGKTKQIKAKFDPTLEPRSDLSKIAFGNRKGTGSEKRITLNLSYDLYQIASDATFTRKKDEVGKKENPAHDDVNEWLYFVTNLVYEENDGSRTDCYMNIDVKRKDDGEYFYSFAIEKGTAPQTLLAEVSEVNPPTVPNNHYTQNDGNVNTKNERQSKDISETDSEGKELTEKQVEYFGNSKVRDKNGALKIMYRGDANEFTVFDRKKSKASNLYGRGFYFTDSKSHAQQYGNATEYYLNIVNPLSPGQHSITKAQMVNFLKAIENDGEDYDLYNYGENATAESVLEQVWGKEDFAMIQDVNASAIGDMVAAIELFNEVNGTSYDGIIVPTETVTFSSEQAKLTTNLSPTDNPDVRWSKDLSSAAVEADRKYMSAVNDGDVETAQKMVDKAAKEAGYDSPLLYHGTESFGFTEFDLSKSDDNRTIFLTDSEEIVSTYSGVKGRRNVSDIYSKDAEKMSVSELVDELNYAVEKYGKSSEEKIAYSYYDYKKANMLTNKVNEGLDALKPIVDTGIKEYAEKIASDFDEKDAKIHSQLIELNQKLERWDYENLSTPIYMLLHHSDVFADSKNAKMIAELEKNLRIMNRIRSKGGLNEGIIVYESLGGYYINTINKDIAIHQLREITGKGNYSMYAKMDKPLIIDAHGELWNSIYDWSHNMVPDESDVNVVNRNGQYYLENKITGEPIEDAIIDINDVTSAMTDTQRKRFILDKIDNMWAIRTENIKTTRGIAKYAKEHGYGSVLIKNLVDHGGNNFDIDMDTKADIYILFNPEDVKSADPIVYDDNGKVIPLSERFNSEKSDIRWSKDLSSYTKEEYEAYEWVRYNDILSVGEYADFTSKFAAALSKHIKSYKSKNGEYIIPVSDIKDDSVYTIDNVLVFAKGTIDKPIITSIIRIDLTNETELDRTRRRIYDSERRGIQQKTGELFRRYYNFDFKFRPDKQGVSTKSVRNSGDNRYGRRSGEEASKAEGTSGVTKKSDSERWSKDISESLDGKQMSESKIKSLAGRLRRSYRSNFAKDRVISSLSDIYTMLAEQRYEDAKTASQSLAERMLDEVKDDVIVNDAAKDILNDIRGTKVWFNDKQIAEAKHNYGNLWHENFFGKVIVSKEAKTSLDQQWQEWCVKYPDYFKSDVIDANMPIKLIEIIEGLKREKHTVVKPDISDAVIPLATDIYNGVWNSAVRRKLTDEEKASIAELKGAGKGLTSQQKLDLIKAVRQDELKRWGVALGTAENADTGSRMSLSEIIKKVEESFGINITHGSDATVKKEGVSGAYNYDSKTVRTKLRNDLPSIAHAIGYHIDNKLKLIDDIIDQTQAVRVQNGDGEGIYETELKRLAGDFTAAKGSREMIREGFAEFIRTYLASKPLAMDAAGNFYSYLESKLKEDEKLLNAVNEAADTIGKYFAQGYEERAGAAIITQKEWEKLNKPKGKEKLNVIRNGINKWLFDRFYGIKQAEKNNEMFDLTTSDNAWVKATLSLNSTARASRILDDGFFDSNGNRVGEGFYEIIKDLGDTESTKFKAFSEYLGYVHALEWVEPNKVVIDGKNSTATRKPVFADAHLNDPEVLKGLIAKAEKNNPDFKPLAERLYKYQDNLMEYYLIPSGAMSKEQADKFRKQYPHYVPFNRFNTVLGGGKPKTNVFANLSNPIKLATGGSAEIRNPIESIINSTFAAVDFKAKNDTMLSLINEFTNGVFPGTMERIYSTKELEKLEEKGKNPFAMEEDARLNESKDASYSPVIDKDKGIVYAWVNGEKRFYQIYDKELYNAVANLEVKNLGALFRFLNIIGNAMKTTMTMKNPLFSLGNFYRDFMTFHYNSTADVNLISHLAMYIGAFKSMIIKDQYYQRYKALGGMDTGRFLADLDAISRSATLKKLNTKKWRDVHSVKDAYKKFTKNQNIIKYLLLDVLFEKAFALNDALEAAPRLAEFKYTMKETSDPQLAMFRANDVTTNFARSGIAGRHLNSIFLFSNASLQGFDKMVRTYTDAKYVKKSEDGKFDKNRLAKVIIKNVTWSVILAALQSFLNRRDEEAEEAYNNLSEFTKNNYDVFYIGDGKFFKLPKEQNLAIPRTFVQRIMDATQGDGVDWRELGDYMWTALTPGFVPDLSEVYTLDLSGIAHGVLNNTAIGVITDVGFNRDYKDDEIVPSYMSGANYEKYYPYTSSFSVKFAKAMFDASGGATDVSPIAIDHYMNAGGYYGSLFKKLFPYTDVEEKGKWGSVKENWLDAIGLNTKFVVDNTYSTDILNNFYEGRELAEKKLGIDDSSENKVIDAKYQSVGTFISKYNKASKNGTGDQQRLDRRMLLTMLDGYDGSELTEGEKYLIHVLDETQNEDLLKLNYPSNEFKSKQFKVNGEKFKTEVSLGANEYAQMCSEIDSARAKALLFIKDYGFSEEEAAVYIVDAFKAIDEEYEAKYLDLYGKDVKVEVEEKIVSSKDKEKVREEVLGNVIPKKTSWTSH